MTIDVKPAKIVSGLEPERTRYLLQVFTVVATSKGLTPADSKHFDANEEPSEQKAAENRNKEPKEVYVVEVGETAPVSVVDVSNPDTNVRAEEANSVEETPALQRPETAQGLRLSSSSLDATNALIPATAMNIEDTRIAERVQRDTAESFKVEITTTKEKVRELSIFEKIVQEQKRRKEKEIETATNNDSPFLYRHKEQVVLPARMLDHDFDSLANAVQTLAESTNPLGAYMSGVQEDLDSMMKERSHWLNELAQQKDEWQSMQEQKDDHLGPRRAQLKSLEAKVQKQVGQIKRLESSVTHNEKILKESGVVHAY